MAATKPPKSRDHSAVAELWRRGVLHWKLDSTQIDMRREMLEKKEHRRVVILCGRRMGKSFLLVLEAIAFALKNPGANVKYISSTKQSIREYLLPIFDTIVDDCPADVRPIWIKNDWAFRFFNGARVSLAGTDSKNFRKLRGQRSDLTIVDEAGFMSDLETTVVSVLSPQALTTGGQMILSSTAPDTPGHDFVKFIKQSREEGACIERTIYQRLATKPGEAEENERRLKQAIEDCFGENTPAFRREYCNDLDSTESARTVLPVFTKELREGNATKPGVVREVRRPIYCHKYTSLDLGFIDQSAALFGYLTPGNPKAEPPATTVKDTPPPGALVIEDELVAVKKLSAELRPLIVDVERTRWGSEGPYLRCVDAPPLAIEELRRAGLEVVKTRNDDVDAAIDAVQKLLVSGLLIIHPRCTRLIACLQAAVWRKDQTKLDRHPEHGHYDLMMSLVYMARNLRRWDSPYPAGFDTAPGRHPVGVSETVKHLRAAFRSKLA